MSRTLLTLTAVAETGAGLALLLAPSLGTGLLLGVSLDTPAPMVLGRIAGAALLSLGVACWLARDAGATRAGHGLVTAMLFYNCAAAAVLGYAGAGAGLAGMLLWPAVALHSALTVWCLACLLRTAPKGARG